MTNTLLMSVLERTYEIGVLRSLGWRRRRVLGLILGESLVLSLLGGLLGIGLGVLAVLGIASSNSWLSSFGSHFSPDLFFRALITVILLGSVGGAYPAWRASRLLPLEALRHEGGGGGPVPRFLPGMAARNLWRCRRRTGLTLLSIGVSVAALIVLGGTVQGVLGAFNAMVQDSQTDLFAVEAGVDSGFSAIDERVGARIAARPDVQAISGMFLTTASTDAMPMLFVFGLHPREFAIRRYRVVAGQPLTGRRQILVGQTAANEMGLQVGDTFP
jgi:ABC-type antimicrobial peptide transport system permease subunit